MRTSIIQLHLQGMTRNDIVSTTGVSAGAVTNIIADWKARMGLPTAEDLREFAVTLKRLGISALQCAAGLRIVQIMQNLGVEEENFESFISEIYRHSIDIGLTPEKIAINVKQIVDLADPIPISELPQYIIEKTAEKRKLEQDVVRLKDEESEAKSKLQDALNEKTTSLAELQSFHDVKIELNKFGIPPDDVPRFVRAIQGTGKLGYDVSRVVTLVTNIEASSAMQAQLEKDIDSYTRKLQGLIEECSRLENFKAVHIQTLSKYTDLENMGFGLPEFRLLHDIVSDVAAANNISHKHAIQKFIDDIGENYDVKLGYDRKIESLRSEFEKKIAQSRQLTNALHIKKVVQDQEIIDLALMQNKSNDKHVLADSSTAHGSLKKMMEDSNQDIEFAKDQGGQSELETEMRINNSANIRHQITRNTITAGLFNRGFPWNLITGGNEDDLEDIREMQERPCEVRDAKIKAKQERLC